MQATIFPWQEVEWQQLWQQYQAKRLPHALLVQGAAGVGKKPFCLQVAASFLCQHPEWKKESAACGQCHSCHLFYAETHPDFMLLMPEVDAQQIKVDQIREAVHFVHQTALQSGCRVIMIDPAEALNTHAANSLLKTLEEPPPNTLFLLISQQNALLPATIVSRCQKIIFPRPDQTLAIDWLRQQTTHSHTVDLSFALNLVEGAPLKVLQWFEQDVFTLRHAVYNGLVDLYQKRVNPLQLALTWQEIDIRVFFSLVLLWLKDLLRLHVTNGTGSIINSDYQETLCLMHDQINATWLLDYIDFVQARWSEIVSQFNLNRQLMLEELFIRWTQYAAS